METLTSDPFNIQQGDLIKIRVSAQNSLGFSIPSTLNTVGVTAKVQPHKPPTVPQRGVGTSPLQLVVDYAMLTGVFTGNSEITSLQMQWDKGTSGLEWVTLVGDFPYTTSTTYTINQNIVSGRIYKFRYKAANVFGWGEWSDQGDISAASIPDTVQTITTQLVGTSVEISWNPNTATNGSPIFAYKIEIQTSTGDFIEDPLCDGTLDEIFEKTKCSLPMTQFTQEPYSLS